MSLLVAREKNLPEISRKLKALGIRAEIEIKFKKYSFKSARYMPVLYHDI